jgi:hypothetical protein
VSILSQLEKNKGTISSKLGKALTRDVLAGETAILNEAVDLLAHEDKQVRAGAAKIVEQVALSDPSLVVEFLPRLLPALEVDEPQTRWMAIHTLGLCAALDTPTALEALPKAEAFIEAESGACLWGGGDGRVLGVRRSDVGGQRAGGIPRPRTGVTARAKADPAGVAEFFALTGSGRRGNSGGYQALRQCVRAE